MLYYILFWMFNGLYYTLLYYFGTNLLTGGPTQIPVFCLFQCFAEKEYQTESKWNEIFGIVIFGTNMIQGLGVDVKQPTRKPRGRGARLPPKARPPPSWLHRPTSSSYIYLHTLKISQSTMKTQFHRHNLLYP